MAAIRKNVRDVIRACLQSQSNGLNAKIAAQISSYGIPLFAFDWAAGSKQFLQGFLLSEAVDLSQIMEFPALVLYTTRADSAEGREKHRKFTGDVAASLDFYFEFRDGVEQDNTELYGELIEDAVVEVMAASQPVLSSAGVYWNGDMTIEPNPVVQLGDGWAQRISISFLFEVTV